MLWLLSLICVALVGAVAYLYLQLEQARASSIDVLRLKLEHEQAVKELIAARETSQTLSEELKAKNEEKQELQLRSELQAHEMERLQQELQQHKAEQSNIVSLLEERFKGISTQILEERSEQLQKRSEASLAPLRDDLKRFGEQVQQAYQSEARERHSLQSEIRRLVEQSDRISSDANSLTQALRGNNKVQGNWGEMILENLLEMSGLERGRHFKVQETFHDEETQERFIPDVIIDYPNGGRMIIDSKVNLKAYMDYVNASDEHERALYAKQHLEAVRTQINLLHSKHYSRVVAGAPDFVILFIPNEPAYILAMQEAPTIWQEAYNKKVLVMNPTNLMGTLKLAEELWRREQQQQNIEEIYKKVGDLYDQIYTYVERLEGTARLLERAQDSLSETRKSLSTGRGNVLRRAEELRKMGAKTKKALPDVVAKSNLLSLEEDEDE